LLIGTLNAWLGEVKIDLATIGVLSWIGLSYSFKFLWSPLVDRLALPGLERLGRRKSWIALCQGVLVLSSSWGLPPPIRPAPSALLPCSRSWARWLRPRRTWRSMPGGSTWRTSRPAWSCSPRSINSAIASPRSWAARWRWSWPGG
jgi:hypothetical protein